MCVQMRDVSVLYLSWSSSPVGMGTIPHTNDIWIFTLIQRPTEEGPEKGTVAACRAPGALYPGFVKKNAKESGYNIRFIVHDKKLYHKLEKFPFHQLTEEQLHVDVLEDMVRRIHDLQPEQEFVDNAFGYYLHLVLASYQESGVKGEERTSLAEQAMAFIEENYMHQIRLEDVAAHIGRSAYHTSRLVKEATGMNVVEHVREVRIKNACRMLAYSDTPIEEIVASCGFGSASYFHRAFRAAVGTTPARYRTSHLVRHTFYEGDEAELDEPYEQDYFTYVPGARKCIRWRTPREYYEQKPGTV